MKDRLISREKDINTLFEIIKNREDYKENSENGLVILLNGSWGSGKSTFLNQLEDAINKSTDCDLFCRYNSYEYDYYETAYIPLFYKINDKLKLGKNVNKLIKPIAGNVAHFSLSTIYTLVNAVSKMVNIDLNDIKDNMVGIQDEDYFKELKDFEECKAKIKTKLEKICADEPKVFIIDELDRCKPSFAMETLEIVKHFFDVKNCIFIIAVDKLQLQESAKTIYGQEMDSEKYFSKFFDYQHNLFALEFYEIVDIDDSSNLYDVLKEASNIFNLLNVSTRDSKKIFSEFYDKYKKFSKDNQYWAKEKCVFMLFLITLKYIDLFFYIEILNGNYYHYRKRYIENVNNKSSNYSKLLEQKIGDVGKSFNNVLELLTANLNEKYIDLKYISYIEVPGNDMKKKHEILLKLYPFIPQVEIDLSYAQNIRLIIN